MKKTLFVLLFPLMLIAKPSPVPTNKHTLLISQFKKLTDKNKSNLLIVKKMTLDLKGKAVPDLIYVMKSNKFSDTSRWVATFLLGKVMGKKSAPYIARYSEHPNWMLRLASLKTLLALGQKDLAGLYVKKLKDKSQIVRTQALENIRKFKLKNVASQVWAMLYDKSNYYQKSNSKKANSKRKHIVKEIIRTIGDLKFDKAKKPLLSMIQKKKYQDIFSDIDYSLSKIMNKKSPKKPSAKKHFWKKMALSEVSI